MNATQEAMNSLDVENRNSAKSENDTHDDGATLSQEARYQIAVEENSAKELRRRQIESRRIMLLEEQLENIKNEEKSKIEHFEYHNPEQERWIQEHFDD